MLTQLEAETFLRSGDFVYDPENRRRHAEIITKLQTMPGDRTLTQQFRMLGLIPRGRDPWPRHSLIPAITAIQVCFRPDLADGVLDVDTCAILSALVDEHLRVQFKTVKIPKRFKYGAR